MRALKLLAILGLMVFLAGCIPVSLHPLFTEKEVICDPALVGSWLDKDSEDKLTFQKGEDSGYLMTIEGKGDMPEIFGAQLVRLGEFRFLDLFPVFPPSGKMMPTEKLTSTLHWIAGHSFHKISLTKDTLQLTPLDEDWLERKILAKEITLAHEYLEDRVVLTAPTAELQAFVKKYGADKEAFSDLTEFQRQK
jgi:hypothetical protein